MKVIADLRLEDVMDRHVFSVTHDCTVADMVGRMKSANVSHVVVQDGDRPIGMLTERDLVRLLHQQIDRSKLVTELMSMPVHIVQGTLSFRTAYVQLCLSRLRHLVVIDGNGQVIGVASERDFLGHLGMELFRNIRSLRDLIDKTVPHVSPSQSVVSAVDMMVKEKRGCIIVANNNKYLGVFTEQLAPSVLARHEDGSPTTVGEVMYTHVTPLTETASVAEVMARLASDRVGYVVVTSSNGIVGTIAQTRMLENIRSAVFAELAAGQLVDEQLQRVEAQLEATLEQAPNLAVQWYDQAGRVRYWNHASEAIYGYNAIEAMGKTLDQLILAEAETTKFKEILTQVTQSGKAVGPCRFQTTNRQGEERWVESTVFQIPGDGGDQPFIACMDIDVTSQMQADIKLRKLAQAIEQSPESSSTSKCRWKAH